MNTIEASRHMTTHEGWKPITGYFVQRRRAGSKTWENMALTWPTLREAKQHEVEISQDLGGQTRICLVTHTPLTG
jgi:hypothetical protein